MGQMSYVVKRNLLSLMTKFYPGVSFKIVFRRGYKIQDLFRRKDKFPLSCKSGIVYYIQCSKCGSSAAYIGKTINSLYERFHSSTGHLNSSNTKSALIEHMVQSGDPDCGFKFNEVKILDSCQYDEQLCFIESVLLKYEKQTLNTCERSVKLNIV